MPRRQVQVDLDVRETDEEVINVSHVDRLLKAHFENERLSEVGAAGKEKHDKPKPKKANGKR